MTDGSAVVSVRLPAQCTRNPVKVEDGVLVPAPESGDDKGDEFDADLAALPEVDQHLRPPSGFDGRPYIGSLAADLLLLEW